MNTPLLRGQVLPAQAPARCHWNQGSCSAHIHDRTPAGVEQHLRQYHFNSSPWHKKNVGLCQWSHGNSGCARLMDYGSFGHHIATIHLR